MRVLRETLTLIKDSRLEVLFSGRWENKILRDDEGCVFIDIDARYFEKVIEYLNSIKVHEADETDENKNVPELPEIKFFRI